MQMAADLGGATNLTAGQKQLIKRCAMISVQCELMEKSAMSGGELNALAYGTLSGHLTEILTRSASTGAGRRDPGAARVHRCAAGRALGRHCSRERR